LTEIQDDWTIDDDLVMNFKSIVDNLERQGCKGDSVENLKNI
jgi:hypothetical protein